MHSKYDSAFLLLDCWENTKPFRWIVGGQLDKFISRYQCFWFCCLSWTLVLKSNLPASSLGWAYFFEKLSKCSPQQEENLSERTEGTTNLVRKCCIHCWDKHPTPNGDQAHGRWSVCVKKHYLKVIFIIRWPEVCWTDLIFHPTTRISFILDWWQESKNRMGEHDFSFLSPLQNELWRSHLKEKNYLQPGEKEITGRHVSGSKNLLAALMCMCLSLQMNQSHGEFSLKVGPHHPKRGSWFSCSALRCDSGWEQKDSLTPFLSVFKILTNSRPRTFGKSTRQEHGLESRVPGPAELWR